MKGTRRNRGRANLHRVSTGGSAQAGTEYWRGSFGRWNQTVSHSPRPLRVPLTQHAAAPEDQRDRGRGQQDDQQHAADGQHASFYAGRRAAEQLRSRDRDCRRPPRAPHSARTASSRPGVAQLRGRATSHLHVTHSSGPSWQQRNI